MSTTESRRRRSPRRERRIQFDGHYARRSLQHEKIPCRVYRHAGEASKAVAAEIAALIRERAAEGRNCVLGLATGSTPVGVYDELVRLHQEEGLSFRNVITFNLDEYFPMQPDELQSYVRFMREHLFDHVDIDPKTTSTFPTARCPTSRSTSTAASTRRQIARGRRHRHSDPGHRPHRAHRLQRARLGRDSRTRLITLDRVTRLDAASDFFGEENVPRRAITMGVGTILEARQVMLMAFGEGKAAIVAKAVEGEISADRRRQLPAGASERRSRARRGGRRRR